MCSDAQSCPTLCNTMNCSPQGSSVHGIFQVRILEWIAIFFFRGSSRPRNWTWVSCIAGGLLCCRQILYQLSHKGSLSIQEPQEMQFQSLGWEDPLEEEMGTHSSILAWKIPWTEEPCGLWSMGPQRVGHDWAIEHTYITTSEKVCDMLFFVCWRWPA